LLRETASHSSATTLHFVNRFVELNDDIALQVGDDGAGVRLDRDDFGRRDVGRPAWRVADTRAGEQEG
jgi:hypothetical protein